MKPSLLRYQHHDKIVLSGSRESIDSIAIPINDTLNTQDEPMNETYEDSIVSERFT